MATLPEIKTYTFAELGEVIRLCHERQNELRAEIRARLESEAEQIGLQVLENGVGKTRKRRAKQRTDDN